MVGLGSLIQLCHVCEGRRFFVAGGGNFIVTGSKGICAELKRQNADLKKKLQLAQQEIEHLQTTQVRLGEINNNYLMLHYLNKNMHNCRHTQKLWEVYISNVTGKGFDYNRAFVLLKNERGEFSYRLEMQAGVLFTDKNEDGQQIEPFIAQALQSKETFSSSDNTAAAVPIINNCEDVIGVLVVSKEYGITFEDLELLDVYVQQTVSTIENVMLNEKMVQYLDLLGQRLDNFVLLHYASKALHDTTQYHEVLQEYLQISVSAMGFDFTASTMYIVTGERWEKAVMVSDKLVIETVALTDVSLLVQIACREQVYKIDPSLQHIAFPLLAEGRVFAVMEIFHEQIITNEQVQIFEIFAMQTSSVLENRHLKMELEDSNKKLRCISMHDGLTGVFNRRWFDEILEKDWQRAKQQQQPVALIMLDVDCFKMYNDTYGHLAGDQVLKKVAACLHNCTNGKRVLPARYGGEEFVVLLPGVSAAEAENIAENLRLQIEKLAIENKNSVAGPNLTISLGVNCLLPCKGENAANLIGGADAALYQAKTSGRNRVVVAESAFVCYSY